MPLHQKYLITTVNDINNGVLTKINAVKQIINAITDDMDPILVKILLCFRTLAETLPNNIQQTKVMENQLCTRYLQPVLQCLFDSEEENMMFKWTNTINFTNNENDHLPTTKNRPDGCIEDARKTIGFIEVKTIHHATNHRKINVDLYRLGVFGRTSLSKYGLDKSFQIMAIGKCQSSSAYENAIR